MRFMFFISFLFFAIGALGLVRALKTEDPWLLGLSLFLWMASMFFEMIIMKDEVKELRENKE